ncbi:hypothetical protein H0H81_000981 [Sphagnurus paluster]|uniref:Uncharacterized protein n=1 Tax=Sphagnurus paluster TaxID=117069 RepID=A0A9P7GI03_9AGAR|nr:hypothetical protein H0H81_000981 [Sphagnurus paluster]
MDQENAKTTGNPGLALPKAPIPVEESRAQRMQRQQARFRDRGGQVTFFPQKYCLLEFFLYRIFVPSNRNTLIGILLGRKPVSPKSFRRRSASLSPKKVTFSTKGDVGDGEEVKALRTSPRKAAQRKTEECALAGPSKLPALEIGLKAPKKKGKKAGSKSTSTPTTTTTFTTITTITTTKSKGKGKAKLDCSDSEAPAPKRRGRPPKAKVITTDDEDNEGPKARKVPVKAPSKKRGTKKPSAPTGEHDHELKPEGKPKRGVNSTGVKNRVSSKNANTIDLVGPTEVSSHESTSRNNEALPGCTLATIHEMEEPVSQPSPAPVEGHIEIDHDHLPKATEPSKSKAKIQEVDNEPSEILPKTKKPAKSKEKVDVAVELFPPEDQDSEAHLTTATGKGKSKRKAPVSPKEVEDDVSPAAAKAKVNGKSKYKDDVDTEEPYKTSTSTKRARLVDAVSEEPTMKKAKISVNVEGDVEERHEEVMRPKSNPLKKPRKAKPTKKSSRDGVNAASSHVGNPNEAQASPIAVKRSRESNDDAVEGIKRAKITPTPTAQEDADGEEAAKNTEQDLSEAKKRASAKSKPVHAKAKAEESTTGKRKTSAKSKSKADSDHEIPTVDPAPPSEKMVKAKSATKSKAPPTLKLRPRKSVIQRIKQPLPAIEDDDPDPIDFLC